MKQDARKNSYKRRSPSREEIKGDRRVKIEDQGSYILGQRPISIMLVRKNTGVIDLNKDQSQASVWQKIKLRKLTAQKSPSGEKETAPQ